MHIDHIALYCLDLESMRTFFMKYFGCLSNEEYHNTKTGLRTYILTFPEGGARLELMQRPEVTDARQHLFRHGFIHMSIATGSEQGVESKTYELVKNGYTCLSGPRTTGDGYYESCIEGPEGILLEITI